MVQQVEAVHLVVVEGAARVRVPQQRAQAAQRQRPRGPALRRPGAVGVHHLPRYLLEPEYSSSFTSNGLFSFSTKTFILFLNY